MPEWSTVRLEYLASSEKRAFATGPFGSAVSAKNFRSAGVPMLRGANLSEEVGTRLDESDLVFLAPELAAQFARSSVRLGDLVFTCWGTVGQIGFIGASAAFSSYIVSNKQMKMTADHQKVDPLFLYYNLSQPRMVDLVKSQAIGSSVPGFNLGQLRALPVTLPELPLQQAIAEVLGALDDKIAANSQLQRTISELIDATFRRIVGGAPLRVSLGQLVSVTKGVSYRSAELSDESATALVTLKSVARDGEYSDRGLKGFSGAWKPGQVVAEGELVVAVTDLTQAADVVGRAVRVPASVRFRRLVASLDLAIVRPVDALPREFVLGVMRENRFRDHCRSRTSGTTVLHLAGDAVASYDAPAVPSDAQNQYAELVRPMLHMGDSLASESDSLRATRDALLPLLMSGKLRVRDAEKHVAGVV